MYQIWYPKYIQWICISKYLFHMSGFTGLITSMISCMTLHEKCCTQFHLQCTTETRNMIFFNFFWYSFWRVLFQINISTEVPLGDGGIGGREDENEMAGGGWGMDIPGSKNTDERAYYWQSHPLWARQREGNKEQDNAWKRESQSEREASKPLKKTLRLTPSRPPPHTQYSPSLSQSRWISLFFCDVLLDFVVFVKKCPSLIHPL